MREIERVCTTRTELLVQPEAKYLFNVQDGKERTAKRIVCRARAVQECERRKKIRQNKAKKRRKKKKKNETMGKR